LEVRHLSRTLAVVFACAGLATGASALTISGVSVTNNSTAPLGGPSADRAVSQGTQVLSTSATGLATRFRAWGAADRPIAFSGGTASATVNMNYTITFTVTNPIGQAYELAIDTSLLGAVTAVDDVAASGNSASVGPVNGNVTGGSLFSGSLGLAGTSSVSATGSSSNLVVSRNGSAIINAVGTGAGQIYTLTFTATFAASSPQSVGGGDEMAFRFGHTAATGSLLSGASADDYAGIGGRNGLNDGHFVTVEGTVIPEPGTALCLGLGLALLGARRLRAA
jgi:hypothetical protein